MSLKLGYLTLSLQQAIIQRLWLVGKQALTRLRSCTVYEVLEVL
jgi:hypothetical protein